MRHVPSAVLVSLLLLTGCYYLMPSPRPCKTGLELKAGDSCNGPSYKIHNRGDTFPVISGPYTESNGTIGRKGENHFFSGSFVDIEIRTSFFICGKIKLVEKGEKIWFIEKLP